MARRKEGSADTGKEVRTSVRLTADEHRKLAALALARGSTINEIIVSALRPALATVRVPWIVRPGEAERADDAA